jgi:hypothetical protein
MELLFHQRRVAENTFAAAAEEGCVTMQTTPFEEQWRPSFVLTYAPLLASQAYSDACQLQAEGRAESGPAVLDALRGMLTDVLDTWPPLCSGKSGKRGGKKQQAGSAGERECDGVEMQRELFRLLRACPNGFSDVLSRGAEGPGGTAPPPSSASNSAAADLVCDDGADGSPLPSSPMKLGNDDGASAAPPAAAGHSSAARPRRGPRGTVGSASEKAMAGNGAALAKGVVKFCSNLDIVKWPKHMEALERHIPPWLWCRSERDLLRLTRQGIAGMTSPQVRICS